MPPPEVKEYAMSDERTIIMRVVNHYAETGKAEDEQAKVTVIADNKTSIVEPDGTGGRSIMLNEYKVNGKVIWAGYSAKSGTVYVSDIAKY
jgi:hypothetical protein